MDLRHGALIIPPKDRKRKNRKNKKDILRFGFNKDCKDSTHNMSKRWSYHAEVSAMLATKKSLLKGSIIVVVRLRPDNETFGYSRPCKDCRKMMKKLGVKECWYSLDGIDNEFGIERINT